MLKQTITYSRKKNIQKSDIYAALSGFLTFIIIRPLGRILGAEFLAILGLISINVFKLLAKEKNFRRIILGWSLVLFGFILSDLYNGALAEGYIEDWENSNDLGSMFKWLGTVFRGWASVILGLILTLFLTTHFIRSERAPLYYLAGLTVGGIILGGELDLSAQLENTNYFKSRMMDFVTPFLYLISFFMWRNNKRRLTILFFILVGIIFLLLDARSGALSFILGAGLLAIYTMKIRPKFSHIALPAILLCLLFYGGYAYYVNLVLNHGFGGKNSQQIQDTENPYNPFSLLKEGRKGFFIATLAVTEKPIMGYGTWGEPKAGDHVLLSAIAGNFSQAQRGSSFSTGNTMIHSVVLQAWLWGGVLGLIGIFIILWTMTKLLIKHFSLNSPFIPVLCVIFVMMMWHAFFSPILSMRKFYPFYVALFVSQYYLYQVKMIIDVKRHIANKS